MTMKLAKTTSRLIAVLAASIVFIPGLWAQQQAAPPANPPAKKTAPAAKHPMGAKHAGTAHGPAAGKMQHDTTAAKTAVAPAGAPPAAEGAPAMDGQAPGGDEKPAVAGKRDPFMPLISEKKDSAGMEHLPPGKAGLVIASVRVDGTVKSPGGMIAVVSNPEQKVYFVREGDRLYDGDVEKIGLDGVTFKENSKDAFGKAVEHMVTKRIYPSAGEQQ
jgi:hypothetical protein